MVNAISDIHTFTRGIDRDSFSADRKAVYAVAFCFVILGEAARHVPDEVVVQYPTIPWRQIRGMRNVITHEYRRIDVETMWDTVQNDLPALVPLLQSILDHSR